MGRDTHWEEEGAVDGREAFASMRLEEEQEIGVEVAEAMASFEHPPFWIKIWRPLGEVRVNRAQVQETRELFFFW